jgi:CRISPR-associated endonuclease/helicase Cas3
MLRLSPLAIGGGAGPSWTARATSLRDRSDLGVFRLGFLEAIVRLADWRASAVPFQSPEWSDDA